MIVDVAAFRHLLNVIEVVAVELMKVNFRRDIVEFPTDEVIDPHNMMPFGNHRVSQMAAEKARDPRNEHLHRRPSSRFNTVSRSSLCPIRKRGFCQKNLSFSC